MRQFNFMRGAALVLVAAFSLGTAQAGTISGVLEFTGEVSAIGSGGLDGAVGLSFTNGFITTFADGTFATAGIAAGSTGSLEDFFFDPLSPSPVLSFLTIDFDPGPGKFSFDLEAVEIADQGETFLVLTGTGTLSGTGLGSESYDFAMSIDGFGDLVAFSGVISPTVIPVPGALVLFGSGLMALGLRRRS
ncbi:MAG: hypothetical protein KJO54_11845 [Gammaproteobacteria bacterium]|nr:hypothetical protein [Gammaproteobacteria bacterium]NNF60823.1 hypothetical protein [Gammaproteobacteria bacterium]NNM20591.1 hypothetical protein [Gammaproteobacteria bacterium]